MMKEMKEEVDGVTLILIDAAHDDEKELRRRSPLNSAQGIQSSRPPFAFAGYGHVGGLPEGHAERKTRESE